MRILRWAGLLLVFAVVGGCLTVLLYAAGLRAGLPPALVQAVVLAAIALSAFLVGIRMIRW